MFKLERVIDVISLWPATADAASSQGEHGLTQKAGIVGKRQLAVTMNWQASPGVPEGCKACRTDTIEGRQDNEQEFCALDPLRFEAIFSLLRR